LREEQRLRLTEKRVLRRIFGTNRQEATGGWKKELHNDKLRNLYASPDLIKAIKSRTVKWRGHIDHNGEIRNAYKILVRKHEVKRPFV
jgi:hypothetical protein